MDKCYQGPLHQRYVHVQPRLGPFNGRNYVNHLFTRGGVDYWYRKEPSDNPFGPPWVWVHYRTGPRPARKAEGKQEIEVVG